MAIPAADQAYAEALAAWQQGDAVNAATAANRACMLEPALPAPWFLAGSALLDLGELAAARDSFERVLALGAPFALEHNARLQAALATARMDAATGRAMPLLPMPAAPRERVSVVICSVKPERYARTAAQYRALLAGLENEVIGIHDARSLAEGWTRGLAQSHGEIVLFSHDDIAIAAPDFAARLLVHLSQADLVGIAGASRVSHVTWLSAGWPHLHGQVAMPAANGGLVATVFVNDRPATSGIQAMDGVLLACRRHVAERIGFDAGTFDGWHLYDFDFSFRAHRAGLRCLVAADLLLVHDSAGGFGTPDWTRHAQRAMKKFAAELPAMDAMPAQPELYSVALRDADEWRRLSAELLKQ